MSHRSPRATDDATGPVLAAGAICWRRNNTGSTGSTGSTHAGLELLLVHSARWGDWSWPKGKLEAGETLPECAVREVAEETGARIELGVPLPSSSYLLPDGRHKTVRYWAGRVRSSGPRTALSDEISDVAWLPVAAALERLTRPGDLAPVSELLALAERDQLDTRPLLVLRHAKARSRAHWNGSEADRPLTTAGRFQAQGLAGLLACWQPERLLSSPWARCMQTLRPYLDQLDKLNNRDPNDWDRQPLPIRSEPEVLPLLSEQGLRNDPDRIRSQIAELLTDPRSALVCTHRPVLAAVFEVLAEAGNESAREQLPDAEPWLTPGEVLIAHVQHEKHWRESDWGGVSAVERHRGDSPRNSLN